jgi:hypothetical protein
MFDQAEKINVEENYCLVTGVLNTRFEVPCDI